MALMDFWPHSSVFFLNCPQMATISFIHSALLSDRHRRSLFSEIVSVMGMRLRLLHEPLPPPLCAPDHPDHAEHDTLYSEELQKLALPLLYAPVNGVISKTSIMSGLQGCAIKLSSGLLTLLAKNSAKGAFDFVGRRLAAFPQQFQKGDLADLPFLTPTQFGRPAIIKRQSGSDNLFFLRFHPLHRSIIVCSHDSALSVIHSRLTTEERLKSANSLASMPWPRAEEHLLLAPGPDSSVGGHLRVDAVVPRQRGRPRDVDAQSDVHGGPQLEVHPKCPLEFSPAMIDRLEPINEELSQKPQILFQSGRINKKIID
jgi:hypothetical protein